MKDEERVVRRGDVYYADLGDNPCGSEQGGLRPVLIIQNNVGNKHSPTLIVAAMTSSQKKHRLPTHCAVSGMEKDSFVLCEQLRTIDKSRLRGKLVCTLSEADIARIDTALSISVGLDSKYKA